GRGGGLGARGCHPRGTGFPVFGRHGGLRSVRSGRMPGVGLPGGVLIGLLMHLPIWGGWPAPALAAQAGRISYEAFMLPNGLHVLYSEDHSAPIVSVDVWYNTGSRNERPGRSGFAHLFEHMMFEGSAHVKKGERSEERRVGKE